MRMGHGGGHVDDGQSRKKKQLFDIVLPAVEKTVGHLENLYAGLPDAGGRSNIRPTSNHPAGRLVDLLSQAEHLTNAGMFTGANPAEGLGVDPDHAHAVHLRSRLADFACLAPLEDLDQEGQGPDDAGPSGFRTLQELARWRDAVSCRETLTRKESSEILRALLRAERTTAELQRAEAACNRRWDALSQEVRQAGDKIKAIRSRAQKLQERKGDIHTAGALRRQELWAKLLEAAGTSEVHTTMVTTVHQQLCEVDAQRQELLGRIAADSEKLHRVSSKRRQYQDVVEMLTHLARDQDNSGEAEAHQSADDVVEAELALEAVVWQQIQEEQISFPAASACSPPPPKVKPLEDLTQATEGASFAPPSLPTHFGEPDKDLDEPPTPSRASHASHTSQAREREEAPLYTEVKQMPSNVTPKVASLIERLSMPRDLRRQAEREQRSTTCEVREMSPKPPAQAEKAAMRQSTADNAWPVHSDGPPPLPAAEGPHASQNAGHHFSKMRVQ